MMKFEEFNLDGLLLKGIEEVGYSEPTEVQAKTIPLTMKGEDIIVQSKTGSGKTGSFLIPIIEGISSSKLEALILVPTRELAMQVHLECEKIGKNTPVKSIPVYGGTNIQRQIEQLEKKSIIVATPGRLMDLHQRGHINMKTINYVVLDEADRMLDMGFEEDIRFILSQIPMSRQTMLFSATMPTQIQKIAAGYMKNPTKVLLSKDNMNVDAIEQTYYGTSEPKKLGTLAHILEKEKPELAIVFCNTKRGVDWVEKALYKSGYKSMALHGDLSQNRRDTVIKSFKQKDIHILVASDVAARGLDVSGVTHVINYDMPDDPNVYVHRIGRTGRAGKTGKAISIVTMKDTKAFDGIRRKIRRDIGVEDLPNELPKVFVPQKQSFRRGRGGPPRKGPRRSFKRR